MFGVVVGVFVIVCIFKLLSVMARRIKHNSKSEQVVECPFCNNRTGFFHDEIITHNVNFRGTILPEKVKVIRCAWCKKFIPLNI